MLPLCEQPEEPRRKGLILLRSALETGVLHRRNLLAASDRAPSSLHFRRSPLPFPIVVKFALNRPIWGPGSNRAKIYGKDPIFGPLTVKFRMKTANSP